MALAVSASVAAGQVTVKPIVGLTVGERVRLPAKLKVLVSESDIEVPVAPELKLADPAEIVKSPT